MDEITKHHFTNIATGKAKKHKDGSLSTVYTLQVDLPDETGKRVPTLIPSVYDGEIVSEEEAEKRAEDSGKNWPTAETHAELRKFDEKIHKRMKPISAEEAAAELIRAADKQTVNMNEGGMTLKKQMELFDEGGLLDEGGTTDPVSGNDVPPGSTQEEVRDDIPAQLSEGEFVVPADVVRYIGLENLMRMRQEAKQGLAEMEAMGQMGNSEEAVMPDNLPFNEYDLEVEDDGQDELNFQAGGYVPPSIPNQVNPMTGVYQTGSTGITGFQNYQGQPTGFTPYSGVTPFFQPAQFTGPQYTTALQTTNLPTFAETIGSKVGQYDELVTHQNDAGQVLQIPFKNGQPLYPVPEGYKPTVKQSETAQEQITPTGVKTARVVDNNDGDAGKDKDPAITTPTTKSGKFTLGDLGLNNMSLKGIFGNTKSKTYNEAVTSLGLNQLGSLSPTSSIGSMLFGKVSNNTKAVMMNQSRINATNILGIDDINNATVSQLDDIGNIMKTVNNFALKDNSFYNAIKTGTSAGISKDTVDRAAATISGSLAEAVNAGIISSEDLAGIASLERDSKTGAYKSSSGKTVTERATVVDATGRKRTKDIKIDKSVMDYVNAMIGTDDQMTLKEKTNARVASLEAIAREDVRNAAKAPVDSAKVKTTLEKSGNKTVSEVAEEPYATDPGVNAAYKDLLKNIELADLTGLQLNNFLDNIISQSKPLSTESTGSNVILDYTPEDTEDMAANYQIAANLIKIQESKKQTAKEIANKVNEQAAKKQAAKEQQLEQGREEAPSRAATGDTGTVGGKAGKPGAPGMGGAAPGGEDRGWNDNPGNFGASDSFAKGGLAKQMKQSGLASKK